MADVQTEHGFVPVAAELLEALTLKKTTNGQLKVMLAIIRRTYGWRKKTDRIASSQLAEATGIGDRNVRRILRELEEMKMIVRGSKETGRPREIGVQKDFDRWSTCVSQTRVHASGSAAPGCTEHTTCVSCVREPVSPAPPTTDIQQRQIRTGQERAPAAPPATEPTSNLVLFNADPVAVADDIVSADRLVNLLSTYDGSREAKTEWLERELPLLICEVQGMPGIETAQQAMGKLRALMIRYYRAELRNPGHRATGRPAPESFDEAHIRKGQEWLQAL